MPTTSHSGIQYHYKNEDGRTGHREQWAEGVNQVTEIVHIRWFDWDDFTGDMLGYSSVVGDRLLRWSPEPHPTYPELRPVQVDLVQSHGQLLGDATNEPEEITFEASAVYEVAVTWKSVPYRFSVSDQEVAANDTEGATPGELLRYVEREFKIGVESLKLPGTSLEWADLPQGKGLIAAEATRLHHSQFRTLTWHEVPVPEDGKLYPVLQNNINRCVGRVNRLPFDGCEIESLLCHQPEITFHRAANGRRVAKIKYILEFRDYNGVGIWNRKWRGFDAAGNPAPGYYPVNVAYHWPLNQGVVERKPPYETAPFYYLFSFKAMP